MKSKFFFITITLGFYCCNNSPKVNFSNSDCVAVSVAVLKNSNKMYTVSLDSLKQVRKIIPLSLLVEDCSLVQLETREEALIDPYITTVSEKYIGVWQSYRIGRTYKLFDRTGKYLCTMRSVGDDASEFSSPHSDVIIDDKNELIYLAPFTTDKILVYSTKGEFLNEIIAPQKMLNPKLFLYNDILTIIHTPMNNSSPYHDGYQADKTMVFQFDVKTGKLLNEIKPPIHLVIPNFNSGQIRTSRNIPENFDFFLYYYFTNNTYKDTLYRVDFDHNVIAPIFTMTYNPNDLSIHEPSGSLCKPFFFQITKNLIMTKINCGDLVVTDLNSETASWARIVNDFYGNIPVLPYLEDFHNGCFVHNIKPEKLKEIIKTRLSERSCTAEERKTLTKTLSTLKDGTNNVVFIGKLREEMKLW